MTKEERLTTIINDVRAIFTKAHFQVNDGKELITARANAIEDDLKRLHQNFFKADRNNDEKSKTEIGNQIDYLTGQKEVSRIDLDILKRTAGFIDTGLAVVQEEKINEIIAPEGKSA